MNEVRDRLRATLGGPAARTLAQVAPAALLASAAGAALGAVVGVPGFTATPEGFIIGGLAVNLASTWLAELALLPVDAATRREALLREGLAQRDPGTARLVAATLVATAPQLAEALSAEGKAEIVDGLETAMVHAGGALAPIAAPLAAALRHPPADWATLQAGLRETISSVEQTMEASDDGVISGSEQRVEGATGSVNQSMKATGGGRIENSGQTVIGRRRRGGA